MTPDADNQGVPVLQPTDTPPPAAQHWRPSDMPIGIVSVVLGGGGLLAFGSAVFRWIADPYMRWLLANDAITKRQVLLLSLAMLAMALLLVGGILLVAKRRWAWHFMITYGAGAIIVGMATQYDERHVPAVVGSDVLNTALLLLLLAVYPAMMLVWFSLPRVRTRFHDVK